MKGNPAVEAATARYIDSLGPAALERAHDYTVGGHWLLLWALLVSGLVAWLIVRSGVLDRVQERLGRRSFFVRTFAVTITYFVIGQLLTLPWAVYQSWWRETAYGRTSQPLGDFLMQSGMMLLITALAGALFMTGIYALIRRTGRRWWLWSGGLAAAALALLMLLSPILIEPLFNQYRPVPEGPVREAVVEMAAKANIPADRVFMYDGSRQSNNFTANASGIGSSARVAISDVALKQASLDEVRAVTGHEIGHYVLRHIWIGIGVISVLAILLFFLADRLYPWLARLFRTGARIDEPRGIPVLLFVVSIFSVVTQPVINTLARTIENQADVYSLRTENKPDALATALVKTAEYRYPRPGKLEEIIFYDHPSVETRVRRAMEWKAAHPEPPTP